MFRRPGISKSQLWIVTPTRSMHPFQTMFQLPGVKGGLIFACAPILTLKALSGSLRICIPSLECLFFRQFSVVCGLLSDWIIPILVCLQCAAIEFAIIEFTAVPDLSSQRLGVNKVLTLRYLPCANDGVGHLRWLNVSRTSPNSLGSRDAQVREEKTECAYRTVPYRTVPYRTVPYVTCNLPYTHLF